MSSTPCLYQETRLNLDPAYPNSVVNVQIPANNSFSSRLSPKRRRIDHAPFGYDEATFANDNLAIESSFHFRPKAKHAKRDSGPRNLLWRVLDERKLLELQAVDLYQDKDEQKEPLLTLRFGFPEPIRPSGIAFAEKEGETGSHAFTVFVLTASEHIYEITLKREHFVKPDLLRDGTIRSSDWCKNFSPGSLRSGRTLGMLAKNDKELWLSRSDGALMRLENEGSTWRDTVCSEQSWSGSMRGLILWRSTKTVRYEDADLHPHTLMSFAFSPSRDHIIGVALDHTIRVWDLAKGRVLARWDLAGDADRDLQKPTDALLQPSHSQRVVALPGKHENEYYITSFSPRTRLFKMWLVTVDEDGDVQYSDVQPDVEFSPPPALGDATVWNLESFHVQHTKPKSHEWRLWMMARAGSRSQTFTTSFNIDGHPTAVRRSWSNNWARVNPGSSTAEALEGSINNPLNIDASGLNSDPTSRAECWLDFLFYPGRFTSATLETALSLYKKDHKIAGVPLASNKRLLPSRDRALKLRISEAVSSSAFLGPIDDDGAAFDHFERDMAVHWQTFYSIVKDLHTRRSETLSMVVDPDEALPWLAFADFAGPVRACSEAELLWHNRENSPDQRELQADHLLLRSLDGKDRSAGESLQLSQLFLALVTFRECLSASFLHAFVTALEAEVLANSDADAIEKLLSISVRANFDDQVSDDDYNTLLDALQPLGGLSNLDTQTMLSALELFSKDEQGHHRIKNAQSLTRYGARTLMRGSQEALGLCHEVIVDLLLLVVFIGGSLEEGDLSEQFSVRDSFAELTSRLKEIKLLMWLSASNARQAKQDLINASGPANLDQATPQAAQSTLATSHNVNLLGDMYIGDWASLRFPSETQQQLIAYWVRAWTFGLPLESQWDDITTDLLGKLIISGDLGLAMESLVFVPETPWATYLTGRLHLLIGQVEEAAIHLRAAAEGLADRKHGRPGKLPANNLLDLEDREGFGNGHGHYYAHLNRLFERAKAYGPAAEAAREGLQFLQEENVEDAKLHTELTSRLFTSTVKTSQYSRAFQALAEHTDLALRDASLRTWITALLAAGETGTLINTSYQDYGLASLADTILSDLATKPATTPSAMPYHKILYAFRLRQNDLRGAASCIWDRLQHLQQNQGAGLRGEDMDTEVAECYLTLMNCLSLVTKEQAWILYRPLGSKGQEKEKRRVITLEEIRQAWQVELDRLADVNAGRFAIGGPGWGTSGSVDMNRSLPPGNEAMEIDVAS